MQWFRMWAEAIDDAKLRVISPDDRWWFVALLCLKAQGVLDEKNKELRLQMICTKFGMDSAELEKTMKRLVTVGLVSETWQPRNWGKRQFQSDSSTNRVRKHRETLQKRFGNGPEAEADTYTDTDKRIEKRATRAPTAHRLPDDFCLTEERRRLGEGEGIDATREFHRFCDHWRSASGANARKHDWDAAWRNWCRKAADYRTNVPRETPTRTWRPTDEDSGPC